MLNVPFSRRWNSSAPIISSSERRDRVSTTMRRHELVSAPSRSLLGFALLVLTLFAGAQQQQARTDPSEAAALSAILRRWDLQASLASPAWNISGELCSGAAVDDTDLDNSPNFNPGIKCVCSYNNGTACHITRLKVYALDVVGQIPAELQNLTYLTNLNLGQNYLTGSLPAFIGKLTGLQYLSLGINALTGVLPRELGNLKNLIALSISANKFVGPLPEIVENLTKLEQLYIDSCGLSEELPSTFSKLKSLKILWASDNEFTGKIPDYVGSLSNLTDLRLQGNYFDGPIPSSLSNLVQLTNLRIGDLVSGISSLDFVVNMTSMNTLVLRNCRISDNLASVDFSKFVQLSYLDLSFNSMTGKVPPTLLNLSSLNFLYLGSNNLSGSLPDVRGPSLTTIDFSYNMLSGRCPSWVSMSNVQVNLVWNNFAIDSSNDSIFPSGLNCLQRDTPCFSGSPSYSNFAVDSGGKISIRGSDNSIYDPDYASIQGASYYVTNSTRWGVSNTGRFMGSPDGNYIIYTPRQFANTLDSVLFQTARMSPSSLRYYGIGLKNGFYNVVLQFAEIFFPDNQTWKSMGKRIFNIYIQGQLKEKDFDIKKQTNGKSYTVVQKQYVVEITNNFIEIHLFWAGKGTCCIPRQGFHGPSISALSVSSYGSNNEGGPGPQKNKTSSKTGLVVGVVVGSAVLVFLALTWTFVWRQKRRLEVEMEELFSIVGRPNVFSYGEIKSATHNFSLSNILGRGGYGLVYKGKLLDGRMVAVKQLSATSHQGKKEFMAEIATISAVQHRNLVKLHGCCIESNTPLLVYECLENGSLDQAIFGKTNLNLDWRTRFEICIGIARGLAYLHEESSTRIVHRDIKTSNVLLDADLSPKISDFGLARHYKDNMTHLSTGVAGTLGYLAPEYAMMGHLTEKADVFAFGIVALEIIAGRPNFDDSLEEDEKYLLGRVWRLHESRQTLELLDTKIAEYDEEEAARVINVALLCTMGLPQQRPPMSKVVSMLIEDIEMIGVDATMRPSYIPDWQLKSWNGSYFSGSSIQQSSGSRVSAPSSSSNNPGIHRDTSPLVLTPHSSGEIDQE